MRALHYLGGDRVELVEAPIPDPGPDQVLVRVQASALCGSERGALKAGTATNGGHEAAGVVESVPEGCEFSAGERVGLTAIVGCGRCERCTIGQELHCRLGPKGNGGWHADYITVPTGSLRHLPPEVDAAVAAMMTGDPLGVPVRALRRVPSQPGDDVIVLGLGPIGLAHVLVRAFAGCRVVGVEPSAYRRELALRLGAAAVYEPGGYAVAAPLVIESSGRPEVIRQAFDLVDHSGCVLQSGECGTDIALNPSGMFVHREVTYTGSWYYGSEDYPMMRRLVAAGLRLGDLLTHEVACSEAQPAIDDFLAGNSGKVVLRWSD
jgi:threonine dehydrogenase-like Zn-dependent dehydrogenase